MKLSCPAQLESSPPLAPRAVLQNSSEVVNVSPHFWLCLPHVLLLLVDFSSSCGISSKMGFRSPPVLLKLKSWLHQDALGGVTDMEVDQVLTRPPGKTAAFYVLQKLQARKGVWELGQPVWGVNFLSIFMDMQSHHVHKEILKNHSTRWLLRAGYMVIYLFHSMSLNVAHRHNSMHPAQGHRSHACKALRASDGKTKQIM